MVVFYRRMPRFEYLKPQRFEDVLELLADGTPNRYRVFAGGTDLMDQLKQRKIDVPETVIDLKGLAELDFIDFDKSSGLRIGALTTVTDVANSPEIDQHYSALAQGAREIASIQIQNRATITGNICNAVSSADSAPPLLALGAEVVCATGKGERSIKIEDFFTGPGETVLQPDELVKEIKLPPPTKGSNSVYLKLAPRGRMDLAWIGVAVWAEISAGKFTEVRIGLGAAAPTPIRTPKAEAALRGAEVSQKNIEAAAALASGEAKPRENSFRAGGEYRHMMVEVLVKRALTQLAG
jgi:carbon-monoxide dehydrogenase medium subunit|tara:strand:+ start:5872 stop:6756 length:885 start_codon:yes stop_codon:yes gene_type:complete